MLELFSNYTFLVVIIGATIFSCISGMVGLISVLKHQSLIGDAISHAMFPGIIIAFIIIGLKNSVVFLIGAVIAGIIAYIIIQIISNNSKLDLDTTLAIVLTTFFGFGMTLLSVIVKNPKSSQSGIGNYLFGSAATMRVMDVILISIVAVIAILFYILFYKEIKLFIFDELHAKMSGFKPSLMHLIVMLMTLLVIGVGIQSVGVILVSAMLIAPGVAALQWSNRFVVVIILSMIFGGVSGFLGVVFSSLYPKLSTGATIVLIVSIIAVISIIFAPKGIIFGGKKS